MSADVERLSIDEATGLVADALTAAGVSDENARSVASALVAAEAEGQVGHGFSRISDYAAQARSGKVDGLARPVIEETGASALIDARNGFAYPALDAAISWGVATAGKYGVASMAVHHSHHCGALSIQVEKIAKGGCVGLMVANAPAAIAPWGSNEPIFGTNPIAFAAPREGREPLVIDLSLSKVARGKVMHAHKTHQQIPAGWALDKTGNPTTDPAKALEGTMVPIGEAKGVALALIVEILASAVTGANPSAKMPSFFNAEGPPTNSGQFLLVLRAGTSFAARLEALLSSVEALENARLPGQRRAQAIAQAHSDGIAVPQHYVDGARALALGG